MNESILVNALGHSAGVLLFGIFLVLLWQDRSARMVQGGPKAMLAAGLALTWNLASLIVLGLEDPDGTFGRWIIAISFSVLSLLPAVLFDLCFQPGIPSAGELLHPRSNPYRLLTAAGYLLASATVILHGIEVFRPDLEIHRLALTSITIGFGILTVIAAAIVSRESSDPSRPTASRLLATMSLFLLAMSFVHLGSGHAQQIWSQELAFHHAAIPLALFVLLQDYRFVFLDAFLRFIANGALAASFITGVFFAWRLGWVPQADSPLRLALLLVASCFGLIAFGLARVTLQRVLTRLILRRSNEQTLFERLRTPVEAEQEEAYLAASRSMIGSFFGAEVQSLSRASVAAGFDLDQPVLASHLPASVRAELNPDVELVVPVRIGAEDAVHLSLGRRSGGRRYLSEDLQVLNRAADLIATQLKQHRETEMRRLVAQAELRALQAQIHPHFLFNALNALYGIIPREAAGARTTVLNLADLFRYFLETNRGMVPLAEEIRIVQAYLEIERLRLGEKLSHRIEIDPQARETLIPILSIQPLIENAIKHGVASQARGGTVTLRAVDEPSRLLVVIEDSGPGYTPMETPAAGTLRNASGVGLENVRRRLALCFGDAARLDIASRDDAPGTRVILSLPKQSMRQRQGSRQAATQVR